MYIGKTCSAFALASTLVVAGLIAPAPASARDDRVILRCSENGTGDISMSAKWEKRGSRKRFSVEFEAAVPGAFRDGQVVAFKVNGVPIGKDRLRTVVNGDVEAEINLDSRLRDTIDDQRPFPKNFPVVKAGTKVNVLRKGKTLLGCRLR